MAIEGFRLMAVGMFTVFVFLTLLVGLMHASAAFFGAHAHRFPDEDPDVASNDAQRAGGRAGRDEEIALALAVAEATRRGQGA